MENFSNHYVLHIVCYASPTKSLSWTAFIASFVEYYGGYYIQEYHWYKIGINIKRWSNFYMVYISTSFRRWQFKMSSPIDDKSWVHLDLVFTLA